LQSLWQNRAYLGSTATRRRVKAGGEGFTNLYSP
jgi:hypothetical protein